MPTQRGYTGQLMDPSGLHYYHARYYDGSIGQFISADTVQGPNRYAYVGGNPETLTDPSGHCSGADGICHHGDDSYTHNNDMAGNGVPQPKGRFWDNYYQIMLRLLKIIRIRKWQILLIQLNPMY